MTHEESRREKFADRRAMSRSLLKTDVKKFQEDATIKAAKRLLTRIDDLFASVYIKVQKLDEQDVPGEASFTTLYEFLSGPNDQNEIIAVIEKNLHRKLCAEELRVLTSKKSASVVEAIRALYTANFLEENHAYELMTKCGPMTSQEIVTLMDLGASKTKSAYLVNMRTGGEYGNPVKLFSDFHEMAGRFKNAHHHSKSMNAVELLTSPIDDRIFCALREFSPNADELLSDARVISEIRRHFVFISRINLPISFRPGTVDFRPNAISTVGAPINLVDSNNIVWALLKNLNLVYMSNHYFAGSDSSLTNTIMLAPFASTYSGNYNWSAGGMGWWISYTDRYLGIGATYTQNFANGTFWSDIPNYIQFGATISGWEDNFTVGISAMTLLSSTVGAGASFLTTVTRDHDVYYRGQYPLDGRFSEIRGRHKIEIDDRKGIALKESIAANFSNLNVPIMVAFSASQEWMTRRIFRTYVDLKKTQRMLTEADVPGLLFLVKDIKETKLPNFMRPQDLQIGDELVETKIGTLSGAFVVGLQAQLPIAAFRTGATATVTAEFQLGLRKLPGDFIEVSIAPERIYELGIFASILNTLGVGYITSMTVARKQSFIFDWNIKDGQAAYFQLVKKGILPTDGIVQVYHDERGPEYLLAEFHAQNNHLKKHGVALSYLEHMEISADKIHAGFNARMISGAVDLVNIIDRHVRPQHARLDLRFDGIDREYMHAEGHSVASNGIVSITRSTYAYRKSKGQGFSGRYNHDIYVTHRRIHSFDDTAVLKDSWAFDSLLLQAKFEDNLITGNQENDMVREINKSFNTYIGSFKNHASSHKPRSVTLEQEISTADLIQLTSNDTLENIKNASNFSGVSISDIRRVLDNMKGKHPDAQALILKNFIEGQAGVSGFAAVHHLLGSNIEKLIIRTQAAYDKTINGAKQFIATFADNASDLSDPKVNLHTYHSRKNKKKIKKFYKRAHYYMLDIDLQLRLLEDDQFLVDDDSEWNNIYGHDRVLELVKDGVLEDKKSRRSGLVSARETIRKELNLQAQQQFNRDDINTIYKIVGHKLLPLRDLGERLLISYDEKPLTIKSSSKSLHKRYKRVRTMILKINAEIENLKTDTVMLEMDKKFVDESIEELNDVRNRLVTIVDTRGFSPSDIARLRKKVDGLLFDEVNIYMGYLEDDASLRGEQSAIDNELTSTSSDDT